MRNFSGYPKMWGVNAILLGIFLVIFGSGCPSGDAAETNDAEEDITTVELQTIKTRSVSKVLQYTGDVAGEVEIKVYSTIPERILILEAEEGQTVKRGDLLATVRSDTLGQGVRQAMGGLAAVRAQVNGLRDTLTRQRKLLASGVVTQAQVDATNFQLQAAEAQAAQFEATVGTARSRRSDANIKAPISGVIGQVFVEIGDMTVPQVPICTIIQMERVEVLIQVPERDLGLVKAGMETEIRVASSGNRVFKAPVSRLSPVVDRMSRTATLRIMVDNPERLLRPGTLADVRIEVERHDNAVVVPQYALVLDERNEEDGTSLYRAYVLKSDGSTVEERQVRTGFPDGNDIEVVEGLRGGEKLVIEGQHLLRDGSKVRFEQENNQNDDNAPEAEQG